MPKIAVIIPTYNRKSHLLSLLLDLKRQDLKSQVDLLIIVVADGCTDGTSDAVNALFPEVKLINGTGNWWYTKCLNSGCEFAVTYNAEFILTMNDDCHVPPHFVQTLYDSYQQLSGPGAIGAITLITAQSYRITFSGAKKFNKLRCKFIPYLDNRRPVNPKTLTGIYPSWSLMTRGLLFATQVGKGINFFDEYNFPQYGSDEDFALRLRKAGYQCAVARDAQVIDRPLLTSVGSAVTNPSLWPFIKSFFNPYSVNSLRKTVKFYRRHGYWLLLPFNTAIFIIGTFYAAFWKYRNTPVTQ